jgi:hypothetical protein
MLLSVEIVMLNKINWPNILTLSNTNLLYSVLCIG